MNAPVIIIGGGLSGLVGAILLRKQGIPTILLEKKSWPFHRVCGEYISAEVIPLLAELGIDPFALGAVSISRFSLSAPDGRIAHAQLPLGGFGISRYTLDFALMQKAASLGAEIFPDTEVSDVRFDGTRFEVLTRKGQKMTSPLVVGAYGKRSSLDRVLRRPFFFRPSPYVGVKYHMNWDIDDDLVELHTFRGGYCGVSRVEDGRTNVCYMIERSLFKKAGGVVGTEKNILQRNPSLRPVFVSGEKLFDKPVTINEISFRPKSRETGGILMMGDAAGMITPLCGNGMAMAMRSAWMAVPYISAYYEGHTSFFRCTSPMNLPGGTSFAPVCGSEGRFRLFLAILPSPISLSACSVISRAYFSQ
ncbi:MAG: NAD(P)/FAD-dependent oxidoreductase [Bacteroidia bacterium]